MKFLASAVLGTTVLFPTAIWSQNLGDHVENGLRFTISAGVISAPSFLGDNEQQISVFPNVMLSYGERFTASLDGVRYKVFSQAGFSAGVVGAYNFGRDEDPDDNPFVVDGSDSTDLVGLGDIDGTIELGGFVEYEFDPLSFRLELRQGVDGGHDGLYGEAEAMYNASFNIGRAPILFSLGPVLAFGDNAYTSTFFDVNAAQSAASGLSQFDAGGGIISYGLHANAVLPLSQKTALVGFVNYDRLTGDAADSSLVRERGSEDQTTFGLMLSYSF